MKYLKLILVQFLILLPVQAVAQDKDAGKPVAVEPYIVEKFVKYAIIAVDQANKTGNYTVLHAMGTPQFRKTQPAQLFKLFEPMRKGGLDLSSVLLYKPKLSSEPVVVKGVLHAVGYFPTEPLKVNFDIIFVAAKGRLLLHGVKIIPSKEIVSAAPTAAKKIDKADDKNSN